MLVRLGFGADARDYGTSYRLTNENVGAETGGDAAFCLEAHLVLRRHGQDVCKRTKPACGACAVADLCPSRAT